MNWNGLELPDNPYYQDDAVVIYHADCRNILPFIPDKSIDLVLTSPPYNVGMEYEEILDWQDYYHFMREWLSGAMAPLKVGGILAVNLPKEVKHTKEQIIQYRRRVEKIGEWVDLLCEELGYLPREAIIWAKGSEGQPISFNYKMGSDNNLYVRSVCEMILLHSKGRYYWDGGTGRRGKSAVPFQDETKDIWWIPAEHASQHPCPYPEEIPYRLISMFTLANKYQPIILDPFLGSGTTAYCAKKLGRKCIGIEIEERYCSIAAKHCAQAVLPLEVEQVKQGESSSQSPVLFSMASPTKGNKVIREVSKGNTRKETDG